MVYDNRYLPLIQYPTIFKPHRPSYLTGDFFITTASRAADNGQREIGIPELSGPFDQAQLANSMVIAGLDPILDPAHRNGSLPWMMAGKLQTQGFAFSYQQYLGYCISVGFLGLAMRSNSGIDFFFTSTQASSASAPPFTNDQILILDDTRRAMIKSLGLSCNHVSQGGLGDMEAYIRWFNHYEYCFKLRSLDTGFRFGALIPTGVKKDPFKPASIPFGGNGHWGVYASADVAAELKEDWKVGMLLRVSKRFAATSIQRLPVADEPQIFGVLSGPVRISPGFTEVFSLFGQWEGIRQGLGVRLGYTLINHNKDSWMDERIDKTIPVKLEPVERRSDWASEYVTVSAFYDLSKVDECNNKPIVRVAWDIPFTLLVGHRFVQSYKVSLGLEFNF